jgi:hypothetical protein
MTRVDYLVRCSCRHLYHGSGRERLPLAALDRSSANLIRGSCLRSLSYLIGGTNGIDSENSQHSKNTIGS